MRVTREFSDPDIVQRLEIVPEDELAFRLSMPLSDIRPCAIRSLAELRKQAQLSGLNKMTMEEIDEIVAEVRAENRPVRPS